MSHLEMYLKWVNHPNLTKSLKAELEAIANEPKEIEERFYQNLEFGTGGLRGIIGAGTNRINIYTVRKATKGIANYILKNYPNEKQQGVVIAHDSRRFSKEFAEQVALVLANDGIKAYLFEDLRPTPELSFAVRELKALFGVVITASHNPPEYNGYKVYNSDGGQITEKLAMALINEIKQVNDELSIKVADKEKAIEAGLLEYLDKELDNKYIEKVKQISLNPLAELKIKSPKIVYSPLHGTGNIPVRRALTELGFDVEVVEEQASPDPDFSTVKVPNPEDPNAFTLALELAKEKAADLIMATDPDADRLGVFVKDNDNYVALNGNQLGVLQLYYVLSQLKEKNELPANGVVIKTIVTSELGRVIAKSFGIETIDTLTGFKYIGEKIKEFEETNEHTFLFGYEESYGYLVKGFVRDKSAIQACVLTAEMTAYYLNQGKTLLDVLIELYEQYGYYKEELVSFTMQGIEGMQTIKNIMQYLRKNSPTTIAKQGVTIIEDYLISKRRYTKEDLEEDITLPKSNVLKYILNDQSWIAVRPSGTEPKIKIYLATRGKTAKDAKEKLQGIKEAVLQLIDVAQQVKQVV
ncbi:phosphoglucomutase [Vulcanibacillus modesticaldus]|uniref:Phosphoglucomutase n=1 Tax=Vulcanibacillus modesticaldus TaxID=337097 RepID=A0A1D2YVP8_9BACI|nr:phospho-sugar mutase [Vulcanibacillus modesticaldus]OEF99798.1 phosphoglucomutase [Vulcanibacillus modesticaldus]